MASAGYDISASTSTSTATNSAAGPATSGGVSIGDVILSGPSGAAGGFIAPTANPKDMRGVLALGVVAALAGFALWLLPRKKA